MAKQTTILNQIPEIPEKIEVAKRLYGIEEYYFSQKLREIEQLNKEGKKIINLGVGSPDLPPHSDVIKVLHEESARPNAHTYQSYKGSPVLRNAISEWYKKWYLVDLDPNTEILPLIGSKEGIMHICMTFFEEGMEVLIPNPGYPTYSVAVKISGATPVYYELMEENNYEPNFDQLEQIINDPTRYPLQGVRGLFVNYPHMPTGQLPTKKLFEQLVNFALQHNIIIVHDNPYSFILNEEPLSMLSIAGAKNVVIELNSLSKSHSMAGWRVGMLCGAKERIEQVLRFKSNMDSGMFLPVQLAAAKALSLSKEWFYELNEVYRARRKKVFELLRILNCTFSERQTGMFVWAKVPQQFADGYMLSDELLYNSGVFITPGGIFGSAGNNYVRVSLCSDIKNIEEAIERIGKGIG